METNAEFSKFHLIASLEVKRPVRIVEYLVTANLNLKCGESLTGLVVPIVYTAGEVVALIIELEDLRVLDKEREGSAHEFWVMTDKVVKNLAMLFCEGKKQALSARLQWWACYNL